MDLGSWAFFCRCFVLWISDGRFCFALRSPSSRILTYCFAVGSCGSWILRLVTAQLKMCSQPLFVYWICDNVVLTLLLALKRWCLRRERDDTELPSVQCSRFSVHALQPPDPNGQPLQTGECEQPESVHFYCHKIFGMDMFGNAFGRNKSDGEMPGFLSR